MKPPASLPAVPGRLAARALAPLTLALASPTLALAATPATAAPGPRAHSASPVIRARSAAPAILITTYTVKPKVQRTVGFNGYATYTFTTKPKREIRSAGASIVGAQAHAVKITGKSISRDRKRFTVKLLFPGEQGNPGKLVVQLSTVGA